MLIVLNIIIILFVVAMVAIWATYGFFSAFLHLMIVIVSGTISFAVWEPLSYWLLGRMPGTAWGVGLLVPFVLCIIFFRIVFDKFCKMNLQFPRIADQGGGAICGAASGVLSAGMLLIGAGFLMPGDIMGFQPHQMIRNTTAENDKGTLWSFTQVDQWTGSFFTMLSTGSMEPWSETSLAVYRSNIADRAQISHLTSDPNQSKSSPPDSVHLLHAHQISADDFLAMIAMASLNALVTDQIDLDQIDADAIANEKDDIYGGHLVDGIIEEYERRKKAIADGEVDDDNLTPETRPTAIFNLSAMVELADKFKIPESGSRRGATTSSGSTSVSRNQSSSGAGVGVSARTRGTGRNPTRQVDIPGSENAPDDEAETPEEESAEDETTEDEEAGEVNTAGTPLDDLVAFFDDVIEKQIQPTIEAMDQQLGANGQVILVDTQWFKKPVGSFDGDGWLRVAIPTVRLIGQRTRDDEIVYEDVPPVGYSIEVNQNTGSRLYVDLLTHNDYNAYAQVDAVKLGWVFILPAGQTPFRFEVRQLGFDLAKPLAATNSDPDVSDFWPRVATVGVVDVKAQAAPPEGIQIGETGAVVALGERLPRSLSPNNATGIEPNREDEPWTADSGTQSQISEGNGGGRNSQMRAVSVAAGARLIRVVLNSESDNNLLADARQQDLALSVRDSNGAEHEPIGYAMRREDKTMNVSLRDGTYTANELPIVGSGDALWVYFQVPVGVDVIEFVIGDVESDGIAFAQPITVEKK